ncbi:MAG: peptide deformylase [Candidatus Shapirobacteria bacterium]|jgi:peptide deformylase
MDGIVQYPNKGLREKTISVTKVDEELAGLIDRLTVILAKSDLGAGLAATQVGGRLRVLAVKGLKSRKVQILINPMITKSFGAATFIKIQGEKDGEDFVEGCLSFPGFYGTVKRFLKIKARWQEVGTSGDFVKRTKIFDGFEAVVLQHEIDHLEGILFIDRVKKDNGKLFKQVGQEMVPWDIKVFDWKEP